MQRVCVGRPHTTHMITLHTDAEAEANTCHVVSRSALSAHACQPTPTRGITDA
jgi:hypothetical protein